MSSNKKSDELRLDKLLSEAGQGTRTEVKKLISKGRVTVNDQVVKDCAMHVFPATDIVKVDDVAVDFAVLEYYLLNKPQGIISASKADLRTPGTPCVVDLIEDRIRDDLFPVGRLDKDTEGLLLITNDGALAHELLSPKKHVDKEYYVELDGALTDVDIARIEAGVDIGEEKLTLPAVIRRISETSCAITIHEGKFHQVKRMFQAVGLSVTYLRRERMGSLVLGGLAVGEYRKLSSEEIERLKG